MRFWLALTASALMFSAGCGSPAGSGSCESYTDSDSCFSDSTCHVVGCPDCTGGTSFVGCFAIGVNPGVTCPGISCKAACSTYTTRADCVGDSTCEAPGCPDCGGGTTFPGCYDKGMGPIIDCTQCPNCSGFDIDQCNASAQCHAVYSSAPEAFLMCASGPATCVGSNGPGCPQTPVCDGSFVNSYASGCAEGCVFKTTCDDCRNTGCAAGESCELCAGGYTCVLAGDSC